MNTLKIGFAAICAGVVMWVVAGLWHNLILPGLYASRHPAHEGIGLLLVAYLILGAFMAALYPRLSLWRQGLLGGALFGAIIGVLWVFPHELALAGAHGTSLWYVLKNAAWHLVEQSFGGAVIGAILQHRQASSSR